MKKNSEGKIEFRFKYVLGKARKIFCKRFPNEESNLRLILAVYYDLK